MQSKLYMKETQKDKNADPTINVGDIRWLTGPNGKVRTAAAREGREAKQQKKEGAEAKKSEAESVRAERRQKFTNGEVVYLGNLTAKKVDELRDICWALGQKDEGMKDALIAMIKMQLARPSIQNNLKFSGLYVGRRLAANENQPPPPAPAHPPLTSHVIALAPPPPSFPSHQDPLMPAVPSIHPPPPYRSYYPLQPRSHPLTNDSRNIPSSLSNNSQQAVHSNFVNIHPSQFYSQ